jgi:hypothetical protein
MKLRLHSSIHLYDVALFVVVVVHADGVSLFPEVRPLSMPQMIHEYGEPRWNDANRGKLKISERNVSYGLSKV